MESAVINLKAELENRKLNLKQQQRQCEFKAHPLKIKRLDPVSKSTSRVKLSTEDKDEEEINMLEKSRIKLEKKAAMYDQIKNGCDVLENDELNEKFLVNFQKKIEDSVSEEKEHERISESKLNVNMDNEKWVEYVDPLGRTRRCLKEDLEYMKERDREFMPELPKPDLAQLEKDKRLAKWDKIEEESKEKKDLHYQDILFDEAREHGVGFMPFSRNEAERAAQREMLNNLGEEAKNAKETKKAERKEARKIMEDRLKKVRQRKRLKLGLPIKDLYEEKLATPPSSDEETCVESHSEPVVSTVPHKPVSIREWDVGKSTSVMDQKQWIESRRKLREGEFAPPSCYSG